MEQDKLSSIRASLVAERDRVQHQLEELGAPTGSSVDFAVDEGFADSGQATAERAETLSLVEELRSMYAEVIGALESLDAGTYGTCENCGKQIPLERLEAVPTATLCVDCKQAS